VREDVKMAVYEYECQSCKKRFDVTALITEHDRLRKEPPACPECKSSDTRQLVSLFNCRVASA